MPITPDTTADDTDGADENAIRDELESAEDFVSERPLTALALAVLFGFVVAKIVF